MLHLLLRKMHKSYQTRHAKQKKDQTQIGVWKMEADAFAAWAWLRRHPQMNPERIGVMGVSKGGGSGWQIRFLKENWNLDSI